MAHKSMVVTRTGTYGTRMLQAGAAVTLSGPDARLYERMGWAKNKPKRARRPQLDHDSDGHEGGSKTPAGDDLTALRTEYFTKLGKRPFNGWDAANLREKIAQA